ncbi:hypothetical protein AWB67_06259 [Caballeronia terrestris]|uniref:Uncharacterized protein n=1 Tax=Caballeronia terrestris TaxID=1226301 RepID=A0A158KP37_9BURK|nr:hypothetical protein AWB67_06259 [Caballeronia terrestris]
MQTSIAAPETAHPITVSVMASPSFIGGRREHLLLVAKTCRQRLISERSKHFSQTKGVRNTYVTGFTPNSWIIYYGCYIYERSIVINKCIVTDFANLNILMILMRASHRTTRSYPNQPKLSWHLIPDFYCHEPKFGRACALRMQSARPIGRIVVDLGYAGEPSDTAISRDKRFDDRFPAWVRSGE